MVYGIKLAAASIMAMSLALGAIAGDVPPAPSNVAPSTTYNVNLGPYPTTYSSSQKIAQARAGTILLTNLYKAFQKQMSAPPGGTIVTYTVAPGVYRIHSAIVLPSISNFKLVMSNVELICQPNSEHISMFGPNNIEIAGPLILEMDPPADTQHHIVGTDFKSYVDLTPMPGYNPPATGGRVMMFTPDGVSQRHYQDVVISVQNRGKNVWRIGLAGFASQRTEWLPLAHKAFAVGNYMSIEANQTTGAGGVGLHETGNLYMHDIYFHSRGLFGISEQKGTLRLDKFMGQRRPGTNRLGAGGWLAGTFDGGSLDMTNSEISFNYDDLTDIGGNMGGAMNGPAENQVYIFGVYAGDVGREYKFYDATTLEVMGQGSVAAVIDRNPSQSVLTRIHQLESQAGANINQYGPYMLVNMTSAIKSRTGYSVAVDVAGEPELISIRDTYLHDGLATSIQIHGAKKIVATGNVIERVAITGFQASFAAYWMEGGIPSEIDCSNNYFINTPYSIGTPLATIHVGSDARQISKANNTHVFDSVTVSNNIVVNPQLNALSIYDTDKVQVDHNQIYNAGWELTNNDPNYPPHIMSVQTCANAVITDNTAYNSSTYVKPNYLVFSNSPRENSSNFVLSSNVMNGQPVTKPFNFDTTSW